MLYDILFPVLFIGGLFAALGLFLLFFVVSYCINKRLDTIARQRAERTQAPERRFWKIAKWSFQLAIFIAIALLFMLVSAFTSVPTLVVWLLFLIVWGMIFLHKFRSYGLPHNQFIQLQNIFEEEDDFGIDDDINLTTVSRKNHTIRERIQQYLLA